MKHCVYSSGRQSKVGSNEREKEGGGGERGNVGNLHGR